MFSLHNQSRHHTIKSLTGVILITILVAAFVAPRWNFFDAINDKMFHLGTLILPTPKIKNNVYTIQLPSGLMQDPKEITRFRHALNKLKKNKSSAVALLTSQLPAQDYRLKEPRKKTKKNKKQDTSEPEWEPTQGELSKLASTLARNKVIVGLPATKQSHFNFFKLENESFSSYVKGLLFSKINFITSDVFNVDNNYKTAHFSSSPSHKHQTFLLWRLNDKTITTDLAFEIYKKSKNTSNHVWSGSKGLSVDKYLIRTDNAANVMNFFPADNQTNIQHITLDELSSLGKSKIRNGIFLFGENSAVLLTTANHYLSLTSNATYHTSIFANWFKKIAFVFVFIYLLFLVDKLQKNTGYLLTILLFFSTLVFQFGLLLIQSVWLPLISLYAFLLFGHAAMALKKSADSKSDALMLHAHEASWHLAQNFYDQGEQEKALTNLLKCSPTSDVLDLMYKIGLNFERRRLYEKALHLYSELDARNNNYKDVKTRLKSLLSIPDNQTDASTPLQAAKTLLMPDLGLQLPVLGRYEIERELGRGAMGVVYLGKDPKINRQVAIKTLDYSQFSDTEIKSFKSRFFREAEAAGRLNHSSIVTVYDVGEEADFAFIAMDYIPGKSLDTFCKKNKLLPINKVYEIIAIVAETLDYAHSQKIIHRDIKPSNIMYEPETNKVKVTDFGIARITDSVHTRTGSFLGSPSYMSPEQMIGSNVGHEADIYALGVSFYQLLTGSLPFKADSIGNLAHIVANKKHKPVREVRPDLPSSATRIINKALQKKPHNRYKTGKEMADAIRRGMP